MLENVGTQLQTLYSSPNQAERFAGIAALDELLDLEGEDYRSRVQRTYNGLRVILTKVCWAVVSSGQGRVRGGKSAEGGAPHARGSWGRYGCCAPTS